MNKNDSSKSDFFNGIVQWYNEKYDVLLPIFYYDASSINAVYTASTKEVKKLIPFDNIRPIEVLPGRCLFAFSAFEYRNTDIGPYNEFSISAIVSYNKRNIPGFSAVGQMIRRCFGSYILFLPVNEEGPRRGGVEIAGYPKYLADITFKKDENHIECVLSENSKQVLSLRGKKLKMSKKPINKNICYTNKNGIPLGANLFINPIRFGQSTRKDAVSLGISDGNHISETLKKIKLSRNPLMYQYYDQYEAILFNAKNIIDD